MVAAPVAAFLPSTGSAAPPIQLPPFKPPMSLRRGILAIDGISGTADSAAAVQAAYVAPSRQGIDVRL